jgi:Protein of unknown function (DUF3667)
LWRLFMQPSALSSDYFAGIRARYIRPVHLYLISSVAFFVLRGVLTQHLATPINLGNDVRIELDKEAAGPKSEWETRIANRAKQWTQLPDDVRSQLLVRGAFDYAPKVMFMLLPLFALLTFLLYRNRRQPYVAHLVFALHYYAVVFFIALAANCVRRAPFVVPLAAQAGCQLQPRSRSWYSPMMVFISVISPAFIRP